MTTIYFAHFPLLDIAEPCHALGGSFIPLTLELFQSLDNDWAAKTYLERTKPVVWTKTVFAPSCNPTEMPPLKQKSRELLLEALEGFQVEFDQALKPVWADCQLDAKLLYASMLVHTSQPYPDPTSSASYLKQQGGIFRRFGIFQRTALLNGESGAELPKAALVSIGGLAQKWKNAGLTWEDQAFSLLRALSYVYTHRTPIHLNALPIVVALEGLLLPTHTNGIANAITRVTQDLLQTNVPANLNSLVRDIYAWRSDIIHGRSLPEVEWSLCFNSLADFTRLVSKALLERIISRGLSGNDIIGALAR